MLNPEKLFDNFFDDKNIIPTRLLNFAKDTLNNLISNNGSKDYDIPIAVLSPLVANFQAEISGVDTSLTQQKGATLTVDEFIKQFANTMRDEEPFIARAVGGKNSPAYLEFYPQGISEYTRAAKTEISTLTDRLNVAATTFSAKLGVPLTATLQGFVVGWKDARDTQQQKMGTVNTNRSERSTNRAALELGLLQAIHFIGGKFPGDASKCLSFFKFNLLFAQTKHKHQTFANILSPGQIAVILNRTLTDTTSLTIRNTDDNAPFAIWLAATEKKAVPPTALIVQPGNTAEVKPSDLGNLANTFLLVKNTSEVNDGAYEVVVV
jgi:hypothetical protein